MRLGYGAFRVLSQCGSKLRLAERAAKRLDGFPRPHVDEDAAAQDAAMQLHADEPRLPFHNDP
jgi:hypothetical protein